MVNTDFNSIEFVLIIQCSITKKRCSGFHCTKTFYEREGNFEKYPIDKNVKYMAFECGGCCGKGVSSYLGHFDRKLKKMYGLTPDKVAVYLSSCMTTDNHHSDRCPHIDFIKDIIVRKFNYNNLIEGTYVSKNATTLREKGIYKTY